MIFISLFLILALQIPAQEWPWAFDATHPDRPLHRCSGAFDPTKNGRLPPPTGHLRDTQYGEGLTQATPGIENHPGTTVADSIQYNMRLGDIYYDRGQSTVAVQSYYQASLSLLRQSPNETWDDNDSRLLLARALFLLGDKATAAKLWTYILHESRSGKFSRQNTFLFAGNYRAFFTLFLRPPNRLTDNNPTDLESGGIEWIYAGAEAGQRGQFKTARADFQAALDCGMWYETAAEYGWAAASYALGDAAAGREAFVAASTMGDSSPNDPFYSIENDAPISALLILLTKDRV